ncbi:MAG: L-Ala-D/L-Glu epimerase [Halanaerobiales bacterium]|nr:L-Ala-D/L-Glu epimerase [Halanaerobiales bacterium]
MKIKDIKIGFLTIPYKKPFKTSVRTIVSSDNILVKVITEEGTAGFGAISPTAVITGDTKGAIVGAIEEHIKKNIIGLEIENLEEVMVRLNQSLVGNTSAKAVVDMALYDLYGKLYKAPLYRLLGGYRSELVTDMTISVNDPEVMARDALEAVEKGFSILKIKLGKDSDIDYSRMKAIRDAVGTDIMIRIDANQGWKPKEAVRFLRRLEDLDLKIDLVEQPVAAHDLRGMKYVTENVDIPVLADESVFSPADALKIIEMGAADLINIKLMKAGGIYNALKICAVAETYGVECMIGCSSEGLIGIAAAAHLAAARAVITRYDLDSPLLRNEDNVAGGLVYTGEKISFLEEPGLGITMVEGVFND